MFLTPAGPALNSTRLDLLRSVLKHNITAGQRRSCRRQDKLCPSSAEAVLPNCHLRLQTRARERLAPERSNPSSSTSFLSRSLPIPIVFTGNRLRRSSESVSASMPPELSAPSLNRTTAPIGSVAASSAICRSPLPIWVALSFAFS